MSEHSIPPLAVPTAAMSTGALDGLTILRFAHAFESGGGVETTLDDLDGILLKRNALKIIRLYIASDRTRLAERVVEHGRGKLVLVPLPLPEGQGLQIAPDEEPEGPTWRERLRDAVFYQSLIWSLCVKPLLLRRSLPRRPGQVVGAGAKAAEIFQRERVDLCMLHFFGSSDADEVLLEARRCHVPIALQNHFANERFRHLSIRKHVLLADGVGGVSGREVPAYLRPHFCNLADGYDLEVFSREAARPVQPTPTAPLILLPARIVRPKGQMDLVQAAVHLRAAGLAFNLGFAGRVDSSAFCEQLKAKIAQENLTDRVRFLGLLTPSELRDWYAASAVVVLPTYHHEGLPRVLMEAQATATAVVAYSGAGIPEGVLDGETGFLLAKGDIPGLADRLARLLRDPGLRERMGRAGRSSLEKRYSLDAVAARHEIFYLSLMSAAARAYA